MLFSHTAFRNRLMASLHEEQRVSRWGTVLAEEQHARPCLSHTQLYVEFHAPRAHAADGRQRPRVGTSGCRIISAEFSLNSSMFFSYQQWPQRPQIVTSNYLCHAKFCHRTQNRFWSFILKTPSGHILPRPQTDAGWNEASLCWWATR